MDKPSLQQESTLGLDNQGAKYRTVDTPDRLTDEDPQSGKKKEQEITIKIQTADTPKVLDVKTILIGDRRGEIPVGGRFAIKYKYAINDPAKVDGGKKPEEYGRIESLTPGTAFTDTTKLGLVEEPKVKVGRKGETVEVEKTELYEVKEAACPKPGSTCAINFKIVVEDPVNDKKVEVRSVTAPSFFDKRPQYIPIRNPGRERRSGRDR